MSAVLYVDTRIRTVQKRAFRAGAVNIVHVCGTRALPKVSSSPCRHIGASEDTQTNVSSSLQTVTWEKYSSSGHFHSMVDKCIDVKLHKNTILFYFSYHAAKGRNFFCDFRTTQTLGCSWANMLPLKAKRWSLKHSMPPPLPPKSVRCSVDQVFKS